MKISEVKNETIAEYLRLDYEEERIVSILIPAAVNYITSYTGLKKDELDNYEDLTIVLFVLCAEMYDNRQYTVQNDKENPVIKQILGSHSQNLL